MRGLAPVFYERPSDKLWGICNLLIYSFMRESTDFLGNKYATTTKNRPNPCA